MESFPSRLAACGWRGVLARLALLSGGWLILTEGARTGMALGVPTVLAALLVSVWLPSSRATRWSPPGVLRFAFGFFAGSLRGGLDVAQRALVSRVPLSPTLIRYPMRLPPGGARNLFTCALSLMPGTLSVDLEGADLEVHVLVDRRDELVRQLQALEDAVARALGVPLGGADG